MVTLKSIWRIVLALMTLAPNILQVGFWANGMPTIVSVLSAMSAIPLMIREFSTVLKSKWRTLNELIRVWVRKPANLANLVWN